jgi:hypothetical protein
MIHAVKAEVGGLILGCPFPALTTRIPWNQKLSPNYRQGLSGVWSLYLCPKTGWAWGKHQGVRARKKVPHTVGN